MRSGAIAAGGGDPGCQNDRFDELPFEYPQRAEPQLNRENLIRQAAGNPNPKDFGVEQLPASAWVNARSCRYPWRKHQPEEKSCDQSAEMRGHADLWSRKIERDLDRDNQGDICETSFG